MQQWTDVFNILRPQRDMDRCASCRWWATDRVSLRLGAPDRRLVDDKAELTGWFCVTLCVTGYRSDTEEVICLAGTVNE